MKLLPDHAGPRALGVVAAAVGGAFFAVATARRAKPLHPRGVLLRGELRRTGCSRRWGVPWLEEPGTHTCVVRASRSAGLPAPLPDVLGLAVRFPDRAGYLHDLLLATSVGLAPGARQLIFPRFSWLGRYSCVLPYRTPRGAVLISAVPPRGRSLPSGLAELAQELGRRPLLLRLRAAGPTGGWETFGELEISGLATAELDPPIAFDPVLRPLPGLRMYDAVAALRQAAYARARAGRRAGADELTSAGTRSDRPSPRMPTDASHILEERKPVSASARR